MIFRRANATDDRIVMAELIYQTDPYIYPFWFNNDVSEAINFSEEFQKHAHYPGIRNN